MDLNTLTLSNACQMIQSRKLSPVELTREYLKRIDLLESSLNAFITLTPDLALKQARQAESQLMKQKEPSNPLLGIPFTLKDLYATRHIRTTAGSRFFRDSVPEQDSVVTHQLFRAGAVLLGKLNMHEIALGVTNVNPHFGACHNPWDLTRVTGGSSGGSAAALAARLCLGSMGTDSGGSIRIPASLCGIVGLKPTFGRISLRGITPLSWNTDHAGPMARCVMDVALLLQAVAGYDPMDPASIRKPRYDVMKQLDAGVKGWRIALARGDYFEPTDIEVSQSVEKAAQMLEDLGAHVEAVEFPGMMEAAQANGLMVTSDAAAFHRQRLQEHPDWFGKDVLLRLQSGAAFTSSEYILARRTQVELKRRFEHFFKRYDLLLMPTTPVCAPPIEGPDAVEQARLLTRYTSPFNLTGLPALSLPCGFNSEGLPIGLQIVSRPWDEAGLLRAAFAYEQSTGWWTTTPELIR